MHDFENDFYGEELRMMVVGFLRDEQNYPSLGIINLIILSRCINCRHQFGQGNCSYFS